MKLRKDNIVTYNTINLYDDTQNEINLNNVQIKYEKKFLDLKKAICKIVFKFKK